MRNGKARKLSEEQADEAEFARLARVDAQIEADYRRAVAGTKAAGKAKRGRRHVGFTWAFWIDVRRLVKGANAQALAIYIYRRTHVCRSKTVTLVGSELAELGIIRRRKNEALTRLHAVGLIRIETAPKGQSAKVTLLWRSD